MIRPWRSGASATMAASGMIAPMTLTYVDRLILGCWQLADGHGREVEDGFEVLEAHVAAGFRVLDCADIYTGVEELVGRFAAAHGLGPDALKVHTKYVPDLASLPSLGRDDVRSAIERSCRRLRRETLDLVQFHWWDYRVPRFHEALEALHELQREGRLRAIGLTNVDASHLREALAHGIPIASVQTQYSLLDRRPRGGLDRVAVEAGVDLLCYGSLAGGLLSDRYLGHDDLGDAHENRSLTKYRLILEEIGGWPALQALLRDMRVVAEAHGSDIAGVATGWCLAQPGVRGCIVGIRSRRHVERLAAVRAAPSLGDADLERLESARARFPEVPGEVYELERDRDGRHGRIMKYGLNRAAS